MRNRRPARRFSEASADASNYRRRVKAALGELGIPLVVIRERRLPLCVEVNDLVVAEIDAHGRKHRLVPAAAQAWRKMKVAAGEAGIEMQIVSAFRSFDRQVEIIREKIAAGQSITEILSVSAPPGYSEHHTGCAVDIGSTADDALEEDFEQSPAHAWLVRHASRYGYFLSYPRNNSHGYRYEPWHWRYRKRRAPSMRVIETTALALEPQRAAHAEEMFAVLSDPAIYEYENEPPASLDWLRERFTRLESRCAPDGRELWLNWVIRLRNSKLIGYVQATVREGGCAAIAYELSSAYWGRGLGSQAVEAMISELNELYGVSRLTAVLKQANLRSRRLLERLGFSPAPAVAADRIAADELLMCRDVEVSRENRFKPLD